MNQKIGEVLASIGTALAEQGFNVWVNPEQGFVRFSKTRTLAKVHKVEIEDSEIIVRRIKGILSEPGSDEIVDMVKRVHYAYLLKELLRVES